MISFPSWKSTSQNLIKQMLQLFPRAPPPSWRIEWAHCSQSMSEWMLLTDTPPPYSSMHLYSRRTCPWKVVRRWQQRWIETVGTLSWCSAHSSMSSPHNQTQPEKIAIWRCFNSYCILFEKKSIVRLSSESLRVLLDSYHQNSKHVLSVTLTSTFDIILRRTN